MSFVQKTARVSIAGMLHLYLLLSFFYAPAQQAGRQSVRGKVTDRISSSELPGAAVALYSEEAVVGSASADGQGEFKITDVLPGRYAIRVSLQGYKSYFNAEIQVLSGRETVIAVYLTEAVTSLPEVTVSPTSETAEPEAINTRTFTSEQALRYAATFNDPARLAASYPGVTTANDQANHISVRGNNPGALQWRLEGVEIVNPNHTSNAGLLSDRFSRSGGGVSALSNQMLNTSSFYSGAFDAGYGNAIGGIMDISLRQGNNQKREYIAQAGLLGLELAAEGPLSKKGGSYLANYRYSTIGILSAMGVPLGDEDIRFQDFSFKVNLPAAKSGQWAVYGLAGSSANTYLKTEDTARIETDKQKFDIRFQSAMYATGLTHSLALGKHSVWNTTLSATGSINTRHQSDVNQSITDRYDEHRIAGHSAVVHRFSSRVSAASGAYLTLYTIYHQMAELNTGEKANYALLQPYVNFTYTPVNSLSIKAGMHANYLSLGKGTLVYEPRASLRWKAAPSHTFDIAAGLHSMLRANYGIYPHQAADSALPARNFAINSGMQRALHYSAGYTWQPKGTRWTYNTNVYYQHLFNLMVAADRNNTFSEVNMTDMYVNIPLQATGTARNYGWELSAERRLALGWYCLGSGSIFRSLYTDASGIERSTRYDARFAGAFTAGKEWTRTASKSTQTIGLHVRTVVSGGYRYTPVDEQASAAHNAGFFSTVYDDSKAFEKQLPPYLRPDLRVYVRKNKEKRSALWALDIQNVLNIQNPAFEYYDRVQNQVVMVKQLGIIPNLSYRVEF